MFELSLYSIPPTIASIIFLFLTIFVYSKNRKSLVNILFALMNLCFFGWFFSYAICYSTQNDDIAYIFARIACTSVFIAVPFWYHFTVVFLKIKNENKFVNLAWGISILFLPFFVFTKYFLDASKHYWGYYSKAGPLHPVAVAIGYLMCFRILYLLYINYRKKDITFIERNQTKYLFVAFFFIFLSSVDYSQKYGVETYPFGWIFITMASLTMTYTIIHYRLMEIDTAIHRTLTWIITIILLIIPAALIMTFSINQLLQLEYLYRAMVFTILLGIFLVYYNKLKPGIDHIFRTRKYDYEKILMDIPLKTGTMLDLNILVKRLFEGLRESLYIRNGIIFLRYLDEREENQSYYEEAGSIGYEKLKELLIVKNKISILSLDSKLIQWLRYNPQLIEKEQVIIDPQYEEIKNEANIFFKDNALEIIIPLFSEDNLIGLLGLGKRENLQPYRLRDIELLNKLGIQITVHLDNALHHKQSVTDSITRLYNRNFMENYLTKNISQSVRYNKTLSYMIIDVDHFKTINDTYGHRAGDIVLKKISEIILRRVRASDVVARYGGDEFVVILPETDKNNAKTVAESIKESIEKYDIIYNSIKGREVLHVTVSAGISEIKQGDEKVNLIENADNAMYKAKKLGRNRVIVSES